jgi:serine phosphatase RsbU (regulator of sigma subunit)
MHSLKTKLVLAISALIVILFSLTTFIFINEKSQELAKNIYENSRSFAELTAGGVAANYKLYLAQNSFVYFNREINGLFEKMGELSQVKLVNYGGTILYDSMTEKEQQYEGAARTETDKSLLAQVQSRNPSLLTLDTKRIVYLKRDESGKTLYVDANEQQVKDYSPDEKMVYLVQPASDDTAVVLYISYQSLYDSVNQMMLRSVLLAIFGIGVGILMAFLYAGSITKPLKKLTDGVGVIAKGDFKYRVEVKTKDEVAVLANAFNKMAQDLEISTKALVYKERVAKELELAAKIQKEILPKEIPKMSGLDLAAGLIPAEEIGGDSYDFIKLDNDNLLMYLGDVTGHGVPSGIVVSVANALIYNASRQTSIIEMLVGVNRILKEKSAANMFMTLVMLKWFGLEKKLKYVSAGHEQMIHYHAKEKKVTLTPAGGVALGMVSDISKLLKEQEVPLDIGDVLVVYSDGIPECWKNEKEMDGMGSLKRAVNDYSDLPTAFAIRNALIADVKEYEGKYKQMDDITLIVMKRTA